MGRVPPVQVKDILPQFSDDQVCDALVQSNEDMLLALPSWAYPDAGHAQDISRAVELLMSPAHSPA